MLVRVKRIPEDEASGPAKKLVISTGDRNVGYMAKDLLPLEKKEDSELYVKLETPGGGHITMLKKFSDPPKGKMVDLNEREDQVVHALGHDFSFKDHDISSDTRKTWLWHWLGLEHHKPDSYIVKRNVGMFKYFMEQSYFHMCMSMESAADEVAKDPSKFFVRLSSTVPGAISITLQFPEKLYPSHVRSVPIGDSLSTSMDGVYYEFSKEHLLAIAQSWIETGRADEYVSSSKTVPSIPTIFEPAEYMKARRPTDSV